MWLDDDLLLKKRVDELLLLRLAEGLLPKEREGELLRLTEELLPEEREGVMLLPPNCTLPRLLLPLRLTSLLPRLMLRSPPMLRLPPMLPLRLPPMLPLRLPPTLPLRLPPRLPLRFSRLKVPRLPLNVRLPLFGRTPP